MPVTVLKICKTDEYEIQVSGEFKTKAEAEEFAEDAELNASTDEYEYIVELPPSLDGETQH